MSYLDTSLARFSFRAAPGGAAYCFRDISLSAQQRVFEPEDRALVSWLLEQQPALVNDPPDSSHDNCEARITEAHNVCNLDCASPMTCRSDQTSGGPIGQRLPRCATAADSGVDRARATGDRFRSLASTEQKPAPLTESSIPGDRLLESEWSQRGSTVKMCDHRSGARSQAPDALEGKPSERLLTS